MKKYSKIILAGGSGQIGAALCNHFKDVTESIIILSRVPENSNGNIRSLKWDGKTVGEWAKELDGADMLINLAGKNVNCRYNQKNKDEIINSRVNSINVLASALSQCTIPPALFIQCASATIYRHAEDRPMTEENGEIGEGFSVGVCKKWEGTFWEQTKKFATMRKAVLRISLVMGPKEGVFPRLKNLVKFGLGGKQGNGKQMVSWIYEKDIAGMVEWIITHRELEGTFNCTAPLPVTNKEMMKIIRKAFNMPIGLPAPTLLLEAGALLIGTETELILKSRWVLPERILKSGYSFQFPDMANAIHDIIS
ncbi:MAG TPA: TIGR01777 family oxidoreductase [Bacteroidia bacterium]|jgi:uncharacterized protein (TIGR01777 family)|nr:TIGR01777 family oxidoreductase [Bacteroidia bacterium]